MVIKYIAFYLFLLISFNGFFAAAQTQDWQSLPKEVNGHVNCLYVYNGKMVAGGGFTKAGNDSSSSIAAWDGTSWTGFGKGIHGGPNGVALIFDMIAYNGDLYVAGRFDSAGSVATKNIARWDGQNWHAVGGAGADNDVSSLAVYDNELYAGGRFMTMGTSYAYRIGRWNGTSWQQAGAGLLPKGAGGVMNMQVYKGELYAIGDIGSSGGMSFNNIARWNGSVWDSVGNGVPAGSVGLSIWDTTLLVGIRGGKSWTDSNTYVYQWDGSQLTDFSKQVMRQGGSSVIFRTLAAINGKLYGGTSPYVAAPGTNMAYVWEDSAWKQLGTGLNRIVFRFCDYEGELYCGGGFAKSDGSPHNYIARLGNATSVNSHSLPSFLTKVYPNPATRSFTFETDGLRFGKELQLRLFDINGRIVHTYTVNSSKLIISDFYDPGLYVWNLVMDGHTAASGKLLIE